MFPVYRAFFNLFTRLSPFLDEKPKKKEEVNVLGDQERKVEQKKVDRWNPGGQVIRQVAQVVRYLTTLKSPSVWAREHLLGELQAGGGD